jgi:hypothetical protein
MIPRAFPLASNKSSFTRKPVTSFGNTRGLKEPVYTVVPTTSDYEIRDYVVTRSTTNMAAGPDDIYSINRQTGQVSIVGVVRVWRQRGQQGHGQTTPVQTTMSGEMRFIWIKLIFLIQSRMTKAITCTKVKQ